MHITNTLFARARFFFVKRVPGSLYRGKNRIVPPVTWHDKLKIYSQMKVEEENMVYLKKPYLTEEQEIGHSKALGIKQEREARYLKMQKKPMPDRLAVDHLSYLHPRRTWD